MLKLRRNVVLIQNPSFNSENIIKYVLPIMIIDHERKDDILLGLAMFECGTV